jgi:hypothetical protein
MRVRIDEAGKNDFARAVDLDNFFSVLLEPGIAKGIFGRANRDNLSSDAKHRAVFDDAQFWEVGSAVWAWFG